MKFLTNITLLFLPMLVSSYYVKIGILSDDPDVFKTKKIWSLAQNYTTMMSLEPVVIVTTWWSSTDAAGLAKAICSLVQMEVDALVFLGPPRWNFLVSSYSTHLGLPFISALEHADDVGRYQVSMLPDTSEVAASFMKHFNWDRFVFIYDTYNGPHQLQKILRSVLSEEFVPRVEAFWRASDADQALRYIQELLQPNMNRRIVLATSEMLADHLAAKLASGRNLNFLLLTPVGTVQRSSSPGFYKLTKFSVVETNGPILKSLENRLKTMPSFSGRGRTGKELPDSAILHYDSSSILNAMFNKIAREMPSILKSRKNRDCLDDEDTVSETADYLKKTVLDHGATGRIRFDGSGKRIDYKINIMQTTPFDIQKIGTWSDTSGLQLAPEFSKDTSSVPTYAAYKNDPPIRVTSVLVEPFLERTEDGKFKGYVVDFLDLLFNEIKMSHTLQLVKDGRYGYIVDGQWVGMIGEIVRGEADIVVAPLTKTQAREKVIDFSKSIMTVGLNILVKKQQSDMDSGTFTPFSFITIWSVETWLVILVAVVIYSSAGYGISRFIGAPDRVRALETKGTDNLSPCGSLWFTIGSLFCRDTGIYPRNLTHRLWALLWWIFCIFIWLLYISMLTSALITARTTITTTHSSKTSQEVLQELMNDGVPAIGCINSGSTMTFFKQSQIGIYQQYGRYLQENPQVMVSSYAEGINRVRKSGGAYALIMESLTSQLAADTEPCDTLVTSGSLNTRTYAVALRKNSTLKGIIDHGILSLMETGTLRKLYEKWFHNTSSSCTDPKLDILPKVYNSSMTLHEVSGLFYLLIGFVVISIAVAAAEYYIRTRNMRMD